MDIFNTSDGFKKIYIYDYPFLLAKKEARKRYPVLTPLNETADRIWTGVSQKKSLYEIASEISTEYNIDSDNAYDDVQMFCNAMEKKGYLYRMNDGESK